MSVTVPASEQAVPAGQPRPALDSALAPPTDNHAARSAKLGIGALGIYGSGALVENIATFAIGGLLFFYLNVICGLSGGLAGAALGLTLFVDASIDPVVGSISDNSRSRHGRRHPFMIGSIIPVVVLFGLLFSIPHNLKSWPLFGYALTILLSLRVAISFYTVPYMALGAELTDDYAERSNVVAGRVFFTVIGGLAAAFLAWGVFLKGTMGRFTAAAYSPLAWTLAAIIVAGAVVSTFGTLPARSRLHAAPPEGAFGPAQLLGELLEVLRNRSFISLFMPCLILFTALGVAGTLTLHANTFFWKLSAGQILLLSFLAPIGLFGGIFGAAALAKKVEKRSAAVIGLALIGVAQLAPVTLRLSGLIPLSAAVPTLAAAVVLGGLGGSIATIAFQSMMADAADEHEYLFGARREGLYFAGITFSAKASSGLGAAIGGLATQLIGFPAGVTDPKLIAKIPVSVIHNLAIAYGPGASIFTALSLMVLMTYRLTKDDHSRIQDELKNRRAARAAG